MKELKTLDRPSKREALKAIAEHPNKIFGVIYIEAPGAERKEYKYEDYELSEYLGTSKAERISSLTIYD